VRAGWRIVEWVLTPNEAPRGGRCGAFASVVKRKNGAASHSDGHQVREDDAHHLADITWQRGLINAPPQGDCRTTPTQIVGQRKGAI